EVSPRSLRQDQLVQRQIGHRLAKPFVLLLEILQLPKLVTAHAAILLAPPVERQFGNADLANGIRHRHALAAQNLNLPKLRDDLVGLVSLVCHCGPPSWSKPYFKVDPFNGGGSGRSVAIGAIWLLLRVFWNQMRVMPLFWRMTPFRYVIR